MEGITFVVRCHTCFCDGGGLYTVHSVDVPVWCEEFADIGV